jgi:hypothetical protein
VFRKIREIEQNIVEQLQKMGDDNGDVNFNFDAHEETIKRLQEQALEQNQ